MVAESGAMILPHNYTVEIWAEKKALTDLFWTSRMSGGLFFQNNSLKIFGSYSGAGSMGVPQSWQKRLSAIRIKTLENKALKNSYTFSLWMLVLQGTWKGLNFYRNEGSES